MCYPTFYNSMAAGLNRAAKAPALPAPANYAQRVVQGARSASTPGAGLYATQLGAAVKAATDGGSAKRLLGQ